MKRITTASINAITTRLNKSCEEIGQMIRGDYRAADTERIKELREILRDLVVVQQRLDAVRPPMKGTTR